MAPMPTVTCSSASTSTTTSVVYTTAVTSTAFVAPKSPLEDPRVSWIHELQKHQLVAQMAFHGLPTEGTVADLRKIFCAFWKNAPAPEVTSQSEVVVQAQHRTYAEASRLPGAFQPAHSERQPEVSTCQPLVTGTSGGYLYGPHSSSAASYLSRPPITTLGLGDLALQPPAITINRPTAGEWPQSTMAYQPSSALPHSEAAYDGSGGTRVRMDPNYLRPPSVGVPLTGMAGMSHHSTRGSSTVQRPTLELDPHMDNPLWGEFSRVRELLGLSPNADSECVQRTLATLVQNPRDLDSNHRHPAPESIYQPRVPEVNFQAQPTDWRSSHLTPHYASRHQVPDTYGGVSNNLPRQAAQVYEPPSNVAKTSSTLCDLVRKWNLRFDGKRDAVSFLERLEELLEAYALSPEEVLKAMPELLHGQALLWFRNNRDVWTSFAEFRRMFELQFFPPGYRRNLDEEIRKRTQGETESFRDFVISLTTLIRRSGDYSNQQKVNLVYSNMRPEYKFMIRRQDFCSLAELIERAEEFEELVRERKTFRPPPPASQALVPETAYVARRRNDRSMDVAVLDSWLPETEQPQQSPTVCQPTRQVGKTNERGQDKRVNFDGWANRQRGRNRSPSPRRVSSPPPSPGERGNDASFKKATCWNCNAKGHLFRHCQKPRVLRCFHCKREGVRTTRCDCRSENASRTQMPGGHLSPQRSSPAQPPKNGRGGSSM